MLNKLGNIGKKKGFTLVELIVVISIIAILTAVLLPLIGNYGNLAAYTTLQDGAQTISNGINDACQFVSLGGDIISDTWIRGEKGNNGTLTVTSSNNHTDLINKVKAVFETTMPNGSCFYVVLSHGAVDSVIYSNTTGDASTYSEGTVEKHASINDAYNIAGKGAVGVAGSYKEDGKQIANIPTI